MKKSFKVTLLALPFMAGLAMISAQGQTFDDALRYSQYNATGSARIMGIGGTQFAIGGDVSNISGNPAGLGFFRNSQVSFTTNFENWNSDSYFMGQKQSDSDFTFSLPNVSAVFAKTKNPMNTDSWRGHSFGISYNRSSNLNNQFGYYSNIESPTSILDYYSAEYNATQEPPIGDPAGLPLDVGLIVQDGNIFRPSDYTYNINDDGSVNFDSPIAPYQDEMIITEGNTSQFTFAYGGNYDNKLFIGGSVGITSVNFTSHKTYGEDFVDNHNFQATAFNIRENLNHSGSGVNLNIGLIYKPIDQINLGFTFSSPTWMQYQEGYDSDIVADFYDLDGNFDYGEEAYSNYYNPIYKLRTPLKLSAGAAFFLNKNGFISADIDYLDYSTMHLSARSFSLNDENQFIQNTATSVINYRVGGEWRINIFRLRAGTAFYADPYKDSANDRSKTQYSGGIGVKLAKMSVDLGFVHSQFDTFYRSYPTADLLTTENTDIQGLLTFGFNF